jgi:hypothetical protein
MQDLDRFGFLRWPLGEMNGQIHIEGILNAVKTLPLSTAVDQEE